MRSLVSISALFGTHVTSCSASQNLMNTMATNPGDPYISIVGAPVELINFLHQSGIIVADRKDDKRVKLVDFSARLGG